MGNVKTKDRNVELLRLMHVSFGMMYEACLKYTGRSRNWSNLDKQKYFALGGGNQEILKSWSRIIPLGLQRTLHFLLFSFLKAVCRSIVYVAVSLSSSNSNSPNYIRYHRKEIHCVHFHKFNNQMHSNKQVLRIEKKFQVITYYAYQRDGHRYIWLFKVVLH